jgi:hypothetical protein
MTNTFLERLRAKLTVAEYLACTSALSVAVRVLEGQTKEQMERNGLLSEEYISPMIRETYEKMKVD